MILSTPRRLWLLPLLVWFTSCRSAQTATQLTVPFRQQVAPANKPAVLTYEARATLPETEAQSPKLVKRIRTGKSNKGLKASPQQLAKHSAVAVAKRTLRPRLAPKTNTTAVRGVQDEGEGKPALLVLGILLVVAGIAGGFLVGGGVGFFVGLPIGLLGYYFFMKGLLGPNAWIEVANELFQL